MTLAPDRSPPPSRAFVDPELRHSTVAAGEHGALAPGAAAVLDALEGSVGARPGLRGARPRRTSPPAWRPSWPSSGRARSPGGARPPGPPRAAVTAPGRGSDGPDRALRPPRPAPSLGGRPGPLLPASGRAPGRARLDGGVARRGRGRRLVRPPAAHRAARNGPGWPAGTCTTATRAPQPTAEPTRCRGRCRRRCERPGVQRRRPDGVFGGVLHARRGRARRGRRRLRALGGRGIARPGRLGPRERPRLPGAVLGP